MTTVASRGMKFAMTSYDKKERQSRRFSQLAEIKLVTKYYPVSNFSYPRSDGAQARRGSESGSAKDRSSVDSQTSVPGMVDDHDSDVSVEDDEYQHDLWDSFWPAETRKESLKAVRYPALIPSPASQRFCNAQEQAKHAEETQQKMSWPLAPSPEHQRPETARLPRATYSLFPQSTRSQPSPSPRFDRSEAAGPLQQMSTSALNQALPSKAKKQAPGPYMAPLQSCFPMVSPPLTSRSQPPLSGGKMNPYLGQAQEHNEDWDPAQTHTGSEIDLSYYYQAYQSPQLSRQCEHAPTAATSCVTHPPPFPPPILLPPPLPGHVRQQGHRPLGQHLSKSTVTPWQTPPAPLAPQPSPLSVFESDSDGSDTDATIAAGHRSFARRIGLSRGPGGHKRTVSDGRHPPANPKRSRADTLDVKRAQGSVVGLAPFEDVVMGGLDKEPPRHAGLKRQRSDIFRLFGRGK